MVTGSSQPPRTGATVWLTGLPSAGKSTLARGAANLLASGGHRTEILDGDEMRRTLCRDLGFSRAHREENVRRIGQSALALARNGIIVLVPVIAPYAVSRASVQTAHQQNGIPYVEIYVNAPLDVCRDRDVKGLYAQQQAGQLTGLTGVDDPYEPPTRPDLEIPTHRQTEDESVALLHRFVARLLTNHSLSRHS
ncbi:adenylyl-sulfate kinase [Allokutzneria albata]|nr:adenylyl-sulfate kinase [Allokutzneria albata]